MKILISSCVYGNDVRWNGSNRRCQHIHDWAKEHGYEFSADKLGQLSDDELEGVAGGGMYKLSGRGIWHIKGC